MRTHPAPKLVSLLGLLVFGLLLATPSPTYAVDPEKYAGIEDDDPNPLPAYASEEDKRLLDELLSQQRIQPLALPGPPPGTLWTPSEYAPLEGVLIRWGSYNSLLTEFVVGITAASANLCTGSGTPYACCTGSGAGTCDDPSTKVWVSVENSSTQSSATSTLTSAGADMSKVEFIVYNGDSVWMRDYGPRYTYEDGARTIIDYTYARPSRPNDDAFNEALAALWGQPIYDMGIVRGGGNLHLVSTGDAFVSSLALDPDEDGTDEYTQAEIEQVYQDYLNLDVTIYERLPDSIDSTGHIDMWMMPLSDTDILVSEFSGGAGKTITDAGAADLQSRGYTVWRVPGWTSSGTHYTYTNGAIVNNKVFIPWYSGYNTQNAAALSTYQTAMPGHIIIQVDTTSIISAAGAIHCVMKHVPAESGVQISGYILDSVATPVAGVTLSADNGGGADTTDGSGYYEVHVPDGWSGTITPTKTDYTFDPASRSYVDVTSDIANEGYTADGPVIALGPDAFESSFGNWPNITGDDFDWTRNSGSTPSSNTGPSGDHTTGSGYYLYTEASSPRAQGDTAILESLCIDLTDADSSSLNFWYHMYGADIGTLDLQVASSTGDSCASLGSYASAFSLSGEQGNQWYEANVDLDSYAGESIQIQMLGIRGSDYAGDIAIDDVVVTKVLSTSVCGDSIIEGNEDCDDGNTDPGDCCSPTCQYESVATVCRAAAGVCDAADNCDGEGSCTADAKLTSECRASVGLCDIADNCDGVGNGCPADAVEPPTTECRAAAGVCDVADDCDGASAACPADAKRTSECRASAGVCDVAEACDGVMDDCPADAFEPPGTACGDPRDSVCDDPDSCDGAGSCQPNYEPVTTECRGAAGVCDAPDYCDGMSAPCPPDAKLTSECRPSVHVCDLADFCDGVSDDCGMNMPANGLPCPDGDLCNGNEFCVGFVCSPGVPLNCGDDDICTADSCDAFEGCVNDPIVGGGWGCGTLTAVPSASPAGRLLLSLLVVGVGAAFLARPRRFGA